MTAERECHCGHPWHWGRCTGRLETVSDGDLVWTEVQDGADPKEPCVCEGSDPRLVDLEAYGFGPGHEFPAADDDAWMVL